MKNSSAGFGFLPKPCFCLLFFFILVENRACYSTSISSPQPFLKLGQKLLHVEDSPPSGAMEGSVAMDRSVSMEEGKQHQHQHQQQQQHPLTFFEVSPPLAPPPHHPCSSLLIFQHSFANTFTLPPAMANYTPPSSQACNMPLHWTQIVLTWSGTSIGRQYDRIAAVWFGGVEFLRTCTAEPTRQGIFWEVKKDVTKYSSLLAKPQPIVVELGNLVDSTYTGIFHINLTLEFFSASHFKHGKTHDTPADLVLPMSSSSPLPSGHWFQISNDSYVARKAFSVPANVYKAVLEIYVSFHGDDEFWYTNPPNEYITSNNLTGVPGNGPFRELQAFLDGNLVAAVWPFPVVYTGGIINLYWRPAAGIGAFNLPTYDFDLTPFVGALTDGNEHTMSIRVENAIGSWLIDGNLQLWLDQNTMQTSGKLLSYTAPACVAILKSHFKGLDGTFHTTASRFFSYSGYVVSSMGNVSVSSTYTLEFDNVLVYKNDSAIQTASQTIRTKGDIKAEVPSKVVFFQEASHFFPLDLACFNYIGANSSLILNCNFSHAFNEHISTFSASGSSSSFLKNSQQGEGTLTILNNTVIAGLGALHQQYRSEGSHGCYRRTLSTKNYTVLHDSSSTSCTSIIG